MSAAVSRRVLEFEFRRPGLAGDDGYIIDSWIQKLRKEVQSLHIPNDVYFGRQRALIVRLLETPGARTIMAHDPADATHLYGFACAGPLPKEPWVVHWVHVKGAFCGMGIGRALLEEIAKPFRLGTDPIVCSHATHVFNNRASVARHKLVFDPYVLHGSP